MFLTSWIKYSDIPQSTSWKQSNCIQVIRSLQLSFNIKIIFDRKNADKIKVLNSLYRMSVLIFKILKCYNHIMSNCGAQNITFICILFLFF